MILVSFFSEELQSNKNREFPFLCDTRYWIALLTKKDTF